MKRRLHELISPIRYFINDSRAVGITLIINTLISIVLANSWLSKSYLAFWHTDADVLHRLHLPHNLLEIVNNFLMGIFFLMAGTEIKRELVEGELSSFKKAILPFGAAVGGMLLPALLFVTFNLGTHYIRGWGVPTATDIAFSLGIASLLGKRVPLNLRILLMALAIIDDLGAIIVIALFYGGQVQWMYLLAALATTGLLLACNYTRIRFGVLQIILALCLWYSILQSGVEASIAGVIFAFTIPVNKLVKVEKIIHHFVNFFILPVFALANTAILIPSNIGAALQSSQGLGIMAGLVIGKPVGIFLACYMLVRLKVANLPTNIKWDQVMGMGVLAGIGFTMSIFTTMLAFDGEEAQDIAKIAILASVVISTLMSIIYFRLNSPLPLKSTRSYKSKISDIETGIALP